MQAGSDVIVVGSGAAGLAAALAAADAGADVVVLERSAYVGGTTALSGGVVWVPGNRFLPPGDPDADADAAARYATALAGPDADADVLVSVLRHAAPVAARLEERTSLRWAPLLNWPDYHAERAGASCGGRSIWPAPAPVTPGLVAAIVPPPPGDPLPPGSASKAPPAGPENAVGGTPPAHDGVVLRGPTRGRVLVAALLAALQQRGVEVRCRARPRRLLGDGATVTGVLLDQERLTGRVVLATGGFQFSPMAASLLPPDLAPMGVPGCAGDGLLMAMSRNAALANMTDAWWMPALAVPGEELLGTPFHRPLHAERAQPASLMVDAGGRRFVDEAQNYGDVGRAMIATGGRVHLVFDATYRARSPIGPLRPGDPDPTWLHVADDLAELADRIDVPAGALGETVGRFNEGARRGTDQDFGRGVPHYDRWIGDATAAHPTLAPLDSAPYYAVEVKVGCMGSKGGPRTDDRGRVLGGAGRPVPGLFAAGNVAASAMGTATPAGGATLALALTLGTCAGEAAAGGGGTTP